MRKYLRSKLKCVISVTLVRQVTPFDNLTETQCLYFCGEWAYGLFIVLAQTERYFNTENAYNNDEIKDNKIDNTAQSSKSH